MDGELQTRVKRAFSVHLPVRLTPAKKQAEPGSDLEPSHHAMSDRTTVSFGSAVALWIVAVVAIVFFLRAAQTLLIPIALAVLIS